MNNYYISLLKKTYYGEAGEVFNSLMFCSFACTLSTFENQFSQIFYEILSDEQKHQILLGECIAKLGGDLDYENFDTVCVNLIFTKNIQKMLEYSIKIKEKSIINYKIILAKIMEKNVKNTVKNILADEQKHLLLLKSMLENYNLVEENK